MDKSTLIIYCIFICINSAVLFFIYNIIARWMKTTEKKIGDLEHIVRSTDEYIKYTKHVTDLVYLNYLDGLQRIMVNREQYEEAEIVKRTIAIREKMMMEDIMNGVPDGSRTYTADQLKDVFRKLKKSGNGDCGSGENPAE